MSIIFADDINDNRGEDLNKRVDTVYDYIAYMKEQLEFWARNRTREISGADAKIQAYEDSLPIGDAEITVHKPITFEQGALIHEVESFDYEIHTFKSAISAGTIGTRGAQQSYTPSYTVRSVELCYVGSSVEYIPMTFFQVTNNTVYCNWYRATTSAISEANSEVRVKIYKG